MITTCQHFWVDKTDFAQSKWVSEDLDQRFATKPLTDTQLLVAIEKFALTANNISYAVTGEKLKYWDYFPTTEAGWGNIPVWGYATVVESKRADVKVGERLWGYWPMSSHLVMEPGPISEAGFIDAYEHRKALHDTYNGYSRLHNDLLHIPEYEDLRPGLYGLYVTSFLVDDYMADLDYFGASQVILLSASSKTALAMAYLVSQRKGIDCIGITSVGNKAFVESLGLYDQVLTYDEIKQVPADNVSVSVDYSGNGSVLTALHQHLQDNLKHSCLIGKSHWTEKAAARDQLPGARPKFFFAPDHVARRISEWGEEGFGQRLNDGWLAYANVAKPIYRIDARHGTAAIEQAYQNVLAGKLNPADALLCSF